MAYWRRGWQRLCKVRRVPADSNLGLTKYDRMLLRIDQQTPLYYFVSASLFSWMLLAGYLLSPSTYASIQQTEVSDDADRVTKSVFRVVRNVPLLVVASLGCFIATAGLAFISYEQRTNPVWVKKYVVV